MDSSLEVVKQKALLAAEIAVEEDFIKKFVVTLKHLMIHDCEGQTILYQLQVTLDPYIQKVAGKINASHSVPIEEKDRQSELIQTLKSVHELLCLKTYKKSSCKLMAEEYAVLVARKTDLWENSYAAFY